MSLKPPTDGTPATVSIGNAALNTRLLVVETDVDTVTRRKGRRAIADELVLPVTGQPPAISYNATGFGFASLAANSTISNGELIRWDDARLRWRGGTPEAYASAGYGTNLGAVVITKYDGTGSRVDRLAWVEFDFYGAALELLEYANTTQWSNVYVDGKPVYSDPQPQSAVAALTNGLLYLRRLDFGTRAKRTIRILFDSMLFGGVYKPKTDLLGPPSLGDSITLLHVHDSYGASGINGASLQNYRAINNYAYRYARKLGIADFWNDSYGGTGFLATQAGTVPTYRSRTTRWPTTADAVVMVASINDSSGLAASTFTAAALLAEMVTTLQAVRTEYPDAEIVCVSTMRPGNPTVYDTTVNTQYAAAVAQVADAHTHYIDASAWITGTGKVGSTTTDGPADLALSSDGNHPSTEGHVLLGDYLAPAVATALGVSVVEPAPVVQYPTYVPLIAGKKTWLVQAAGSFILREDGAGTSGAGTSAEGAFYLNPAETPKLRLTGEVLCNDTAPTSTFTFRLKPAGTIAGGVGVLGSTPGAAVTNASAAVAAPAANSLTEAHSADFDCPAAGFYVVEVQITTNMVANSAALNRFKLEARRS